MKVFLLRIGLFKKSFRQWEDLLSHEVNGKAKRNSYVMSDNYRYYYGEKKLETKYIAIQ